MWTTAHRCRRAADSVRRGERKLADQTRIVRALTAAETVAVRKSRAGTVRARKARAGMAIARKAQAEMAIALRKPAGTVDAHRNRGVTVAAAPVISAVRATAPSPMPAVTATALRLRSATATEPFPSAMATACRSATATANRRAQARRAAWACIAACRHGAVTAEKGSDPATYAAAVSGVGSTEEAAQCGLFGLDLETPDKPDPYRHHE